MATEQRRGHAVKIRAPGERRSMSRSATRALDILELFGQAQKPLRAIEISHALALGPSTTSQLLKTMVESAHLTFNAATKTYLPSPRLAQFGSWMVANYGANEQFQSLLRDVQKATGETVTLTTPNDIFMQIIVLAGEWDSVGTAVRGLRISIFGSTVGTAYLSTLADVDIIRLAERARVHTTALADIIAEVKRTRRDGVVDGPNQSGEIWSIAVPLREQGTQTPLVLGLAGPSERIKPRIASLRETIRQAAA